VIVTIEESVFASPRVDPLLLLGLLRHGFEGRHILLTQPLFRKNPRLEAWLKERDPLIQEMSMEALARSLSASSSASTRVEVRVEARDQSHWEGRLPLLTAEDAALLLGMPLHLVLEDRLTDKYFLLCVLPEPRRTELRRALARGWCRVEHGGGVDNMRRYVESLKREHAERLRTWLMFDSDAPVQGVPSQKSKLLQTDCEEQSLPHHQLQRRSIENYLPPEALWWWTSRYRSHETTRRQRLVQEFEAMPATQRQHLDMKERFGSDIAELFEEKEFRIDPRWLDKDGQSPELDSIMRGIFERM
jgi:hypothetical protein